PGDGRHISPKVACKLYRKRPHASACTIYQLLLSALDMALPQKMYCVKSPHRKGSGLLIGHSGRFECQHPVFRQTGVLSIRTQMKTAPCKNLVTFLKSCDLFADCLNFSGELLS